MGQIDIESMFAVTTKILKIEFYDEVYSNLLEEQRKCHVKILFKFRERYTNRTLNIAQERGERINFYQKITI